MDPVRQYSSAWLNDRLSELAPALREFDHRNGLTGLLGASIAAAFGSGNADERLPLRERAKSDRVGLEQDHGELFQALGLKVRVTREGSAMLSPSGTEFARTYAFDVTDGKRMASTLEQLTEAELGSDARAALALVGKRIVKQILDAKEAVADGQVELLGHAKKILPALATFAELHHYVKASELADACDNRYVREFAAAVRATILAGPNDREFGPHLWHTDGSPESLEKSWQKALDVYGAVLENPRASAFAARLRDNLGDALVTCYNYSVAEAGVPPPDPVVT